MKYLILALFTLLGMSARAQDKLRSIPLADTVSTVTIDRPGDVFVVTQSGQIQKFTADGKLLLLYKADTLPTLFDPRDGARHFIYYRPGQRYRYLNPSFVPLASYQVDPSFAIQPWLVCPSGEYKLWVLDQADNSLKKVNVRAAEVEVEVIIDSDVIADVTRFTTIREYQGFVFLLNPARGIEIFNSLGMHIRTLEAPGVRNFNFLGEDLYYLKGDKLTLFNLFTATSRSRNVPGGYREALLTEERLILFTSRQMDIFDFEIH